MQQETIDWIVEALMWAFSGGLLVGLIVLFVTYDLFWTGIAAGSAFAICGALGERARGVLTWLFENLWWFT